MDASGLKRENRTETLLRGLISSGLCVMYHDADMSVRLIENKPPSWPDEAVAMAAGDVAIFDPFTAERVLAAKREVLVQGIPQRIEAPQRRDGADLLWFELSIEPDRGAEGMARGLFVSVADITLTKRREAALRDLLFEVSHRSRNMLAILQSILGQTAQTATSIVGFEEKFRGRIASLAQSQDLITFANWQWVRLRRLAEIQVAPFADNTGVMPVIEGLDPLISPNAAMYVGLALHELAANSRDFGVLGSGKGAILVTVAPASGGVRLEWTETPAEPAIPAVAAWGFGRTVLETVVPRAMQAAAVYTVEPGLVHYALELPGPDGEDMPPEPEGPHRLRTGR